MLKLSCDITVHFLSCLDRYTVTGYVTKHSFERCLKNSGPKAKQKESLHISIYEDISFIITSKQLIRQWTDINTNAPTLTQLSVGWYAGLLFVYR